MWIDSDPVLHIIDRATRYSVAKFLKNVSAEQVWDVIVNSWVIIFTGYPAIINHDQRPQFTAEHFQISCSQMGIVTKETSTQSHDSLGLYERYYSIVRRIYNELKEDIPLMPRETRLSLAVHAVNNIAGSDSLTPTVLVFGTTPRIPLRSSDSLSSSKKSRQEAMRLARKEMETITAQRRIKAALKYRHVLHPHPCFKFGDKFRVWREELGRYTGPYRVHGYDNEKTVWLMTDKICPFSTSIVRLISTPRSDRIDNLPVPRDRVEVYWPDDRKYCLGTVTRKNFNEKLIVCL